MKTTTDYLRNHPTLLRVLALVFLAVALGAYWVTYAIEAGNLNAMHLRSDNDKTNMLNMTLLTIAGCAVCTCALPLFKGSGHRVFLVLLAAASGVAVAYHLAKGYQARITIARHAQLGQQADMGMAEELGSINQQSQETARTAAKVANASSDYAPTSKYGANLLTNAGASLRTAAAETSAATARAEKRRTLLLGQGITEAQIWGPADWNGQRDLLPYVVFAAVLLVELFGAIGSMGFGICATELLAMSALRRQTAMNTPQPLDDVDDPGKVVKLRPVAGAADPATLAGAALLAGGSATMMAPASLAHIATFGGAPVHARAEKTPGFSADWLRQFVPASKTDSVTRSVPAVPGSVIGQSQVQQVQKTPEIQPVATTESGTRKAAKSGTRSGTQAGTERASTGRAVGVTDELYATIKAAVRASRTGFSVRDLKATYGLGTDTVRTVQARLEGDGVLVKRPGSAGYTMAQGTVSRARRAA